MLTNSGMSYSSRRNREKSIRKNIKETQLNLFHINKNMQGGIHYPYSLQQGNQQKFKSQAFDSQNFSQNNRYNQSAIHQMDSFYTQRQNNQKQKQSSVYSSKLQKRGNLIMASQKQKYFQQQQNISDFCNTDQQATIQLQIHLTISKKKYTLKIQDHNQNYDLTSIVQKFLIDNQISNPTKKSYNKTKDSIISMVQKKLMERSKQNVQQIIRLSHQKRINDQLLKQSIKRKQIQDLKKTNKISSQNSKGLPPKSKFEKPVIHQKSIEKYKTSSFEDPQYENQQQCSPSFKSSYHAPDSKVMTNRFSPQPKHTQNKYQKMVAEYYNDQIQQDYLEEQPSIKTNHLIASKGLKGSKTSKNSIKQKQLKKQIQIQHNPKSVYQKWKQKQKQKPSVQKSQNLPKTDIKNNTPIKQINLKEKQRNWNDKRQKYYTRDSEQGPRYNQKYYNSQVSPCKSIHKSPSIVKNKQNLQKSAYNHQKNNKSKYNDIQNNQSRNRSPLTKKKSNNHSFLQNRKNGDRQISPYGKSNSRLSNTKSNRPISSDYLQEDPSQQTLIHDISPDHFYKQGLIFQAKRDIQNNKKFHQIYPFTTKRNQEQYSQHSSRRDTIQSNKRDTIQSNKRDTIQSNRLSTRQKNLAPHTNRETSKQHNLTYNYSTKLKEKQKSQLHQRLYRQSSQKQIKKLALQVQNQAKKINLFKKTPNSNSQKSLMLANLQHIKGLSPRIKQQLIEKNISIKSKLKQADSKIDQQLNDMIMQGKFQKPYQITKVSKSPFRKTKIY